MIPQYRFFLQVGAGGTQVAASPVYGDNLALNYEMEQGQRFFRAKLNGKLWTRIDRGESDWNRNMTIDTKRQKNQIFPVFF